MKKLLVVLVLFGFLPLFDGELESSPSFVSYDGISSWYAEFSPGIRETTANMEIFDHDKMTCAMWDVPFNTMLEVTNVDNGKKIIVRVNDRGPARRLVSEGRIIDLTMAAFRKIANLDNGLIKVRVRILK